MLRVLKEEYCMEVSGSIGCQFARVVEAQVSSVKYPISSITVEMRSKVKL